MRGLGGWRADRRGEQIRVRGVDLLESRNGKIIKKDSYWKIVEE